MQISAELALTLVRESPLSLYLETLVGQSIPRAVSIRHIEEDCLPDEVAVETDKGPKYVPWFGSTFYISSGKLVVVSQYGNRYVFSPERKSN
jgi:hypothetical protein